MRDAAPGTVIALNDPGLHIITYYSVDSFGNAEPAKTLTVAIDTCRLEVHQDGADVVICGSDDSETIEVKVKDNFVKVWINNTFLGTATLGVGGHVIVRARDGDDTVLFKGDASAEIHGGRGNDILHGGHGHDVLFGDEGNDLLSGGLGNDVLIGGLGSDQLNDEMGNNILVGGTFLPDFTANFARLRAISDAWAISMGASLGARTADLDLASDDDSTSGRSDDVLDGEEDVFRGGGQNWFVVDARDNITGPWKRKKGDFVQVI